MSAKIEVNSIPKEIDERLMQVIESFEKAIEYCKEVRSGTIEQDGNLYYLLHDWSKNHAEYNDELESWWAELAEFYNDKFASEENFIPA